MKTVETDVAVIGAGTAGLTAYHAARREGKRALLIESGAYGTMCARVGCMPSKLLIAAADAAHAAQSTGIFGVHVDGKVRVDGHEVMARVKRERDRFVGFVLENVEAFPANDKLCGAARFLSDNVLQVGDHTRVQTKAIVIATGSTPQVAKTFTSLGDRAVINDDVFYWDTLPKRVVVFGPGVIGLELGQALARLGVFVRVFGRRGSLGGLADLAVLERARNIFQKEFYLDPDARVLETRREGDTVQVRFLSLDNKELTETFDYALIAAGRLPNVHALGLDKTSAELDEKGVPVYDLGTLQLGRSCIFIAGDVDNDKPVLHEAAAEGRIAGKNAARFPDVESGRRTTPLAVVFTDPQLAQIGQSPRDLKQGAYVVGKVDFADQGRSRVMAQNRGLLHVYADRQTGCLLGAQMVGPAAEHIAHLLAWVIEQKLTVAEILELPFYHPVIEEGLRTALREAARQVTSSKVCAQTPQAV